MPPVVLSWRPNRCVPPSFLGRHLGTDEESAICLRRNEARSVGMEALTRNATYDIRCDEVPGPGIAHFDICGCDLHRFDDVTMAPTMKPALYKVLGTKQN